MFVNISWILDPGILSSYLSLNKNCFFFICKYSIYWSSTVFVVVPVFHETICTFYMEFNFHLYPVWKERKTEILIYCRCQSPLRTLIRLITTLNWIYFHFIYLFMGHGTLPSIFLHRFEHRAELMVAPLVWILNTRCIEMYIYKSDIRKRGTPQSKSLTFHTEIYQETKLGKTSTHMLSNFQCHCDPNFNS